MVVWLKTQVIQSELSDVRKTEDPYVYYGCIAVTRVNARTYTMQFIEPAKDKLVRMSSQELIFYLLTISEAVEIDILNYSCKCVYVRDYFAYKFLVETILSLLQEKNLGNSVSTEEAKGRYNIARGASGDSV